MLVSESVWKSVGMNTNGIWYPSMRMQRVLQEFQDEGILRIEISYTASSLKAEEKLLSPGFPQRAIADLDAVLEILKKTDGIGFKLKMADLLESFSDTAKKSQLFIQQPSVAALIYARNDKKGSYCGFYKPINPKCAFDYRNFL